MIRDRAPRCRLEWCSTSARGSDLPGADERPLLQGGQVVQVLVGRHPANLARTGADPGLLRSTSGRELLLRVGVDQGLQGGEQGRAGGLVGDRVDLEGRLRDGDVLDDQRAGDAGRAGGVGVRPLGAVRGGSGAEDAEGLGLDGAGP